MRLTLPHYFDFGTALPTGKLDTAEAWDALRTASGPFAIASDRDELRQMLEGHPAVMGRAAAVSRLADRSLASYGVGGGLLEAALDVPHLTVTEFAPVTVERLRALLPAAEVVQHDLKRDPPLEADLHVFHRIDTEFTNTEWRHIFDGFSRERVVFVPGSISSVREMATHLFDHVYVALHGRRDARSGLMRTRGAIEALWKRTHRAETVWLGDTEGWILYPAHR